MEAAVAGVTRVPATVGTGAEEKAATAKVTGVPATAGMGHMGGAGICGHKRAA